MAMFLLKACKAAPLLQAGLPWLARSNAAALCSSSAPLSQHLYRPALHQDEPSGNFSRGTGEYEPSLLTDIRMITVQALLLAIPSGYAAAICECQVSSDQEAIGAQA